MKSKVKGAFVISLDFELHWGSVEKWDLDKKKVYFDNTRKSIPLVLDLLTRYDVHATWATVGFLFAKNKKQLLSLCPKEVPVYKKEYISTYNLINNNKIGNNEEEDPYHYASSLISKIVDTPNQEIATHTFSHYYCNEDGQNETQFNADLKAAQNIAKTNFGIQLKSLVFPRNQFNADYLNIAKQNGITVVRSNPNVWFWKNQSNISSLLRAIDTIMPISSTLTINRNKLKNNRILVLPSSRFFRPYSKKEKLIQKIKLNRILSEMTFAAKNNKIYHLWWHPHNFGYNTLLNLNQLEKILNHFTFLKNKYKMESLNMLEIYNDKVM